jgi:hypothetical protein
MPRGVQELPDSERPLCPGCNHNVRPIKRYSKIDGRPLFGPKCHNCLGYTKSRKKKKPYWRAIERKKETMTCEKCGFKAEHKCQLDVDHIDGNHDNNDPANHQVLCANCHRLKTRLNKDDVGRKNP